MKFTVLIYQALLMLAAIFVCCHPTSAQTVQQGLSAPRKNGLDWTESSMKRHGKGRNQSAG